MPEFAQKATPLYAVLWKNVKWEWMDACEKAFQALKTTLTSPPVLALPDFAKPFIVETDASDYAIGTILTQPQADGSGAPIAYYSKALTSA